MPWEVCTAVSKREEFVRFAVAREESLSELCRRYGVSRPTGYKWLGRAEEGFRDRSRRPLTSPARTDVATEKLVCALRQRHPSLGWP